MKEEFIRMLSQTQFSRRDFGKKLGIGGAGIAGATLLGGTAVSAFADDGDKDEDDQMSQSDVDILNFALNLEYLEAEFYYIASNGSTIEAAGVIPADAVSGPTLPASAHSVPGFEKSDVAYLASALRDDEVAHVLFLRAALGSAAVPKPKIDLSPLASALENDRNFIIAAALLEPVGTSAYAGAAPLIKNSTILAAAAGIGFTEAQHSGAMRTEAIRRGFQVPMADKKGVPPLPDSTFFVDKKTGLTIPRSAQEVLAIVKPFFPDGLNGNIR